MLVVALGTNNKGKVEALTEFLDESKYTSLVVKRYFKNLDESKISSTPKILTFSVSSDVSDQPMTLEETLKGAPFL